MVEKNYNKLAQTAEKKVNKFGRAISINKFTDTPEDSDKPWRGQSDPSAVLDKTIKAKAVFVHPSSMNQLGKQTISEDLKKRSEKICIMAPGISTITDDLAEFTEIVDSDSSHWNIQGVETLTPGPKRLLYFIGVKR